MKNNIFDINCKKVTSFYEKQSVAELNWVEKFQLKLHLAFCPDGCKKYVKQSQLIDKCMDTFKGNDNQELSNDAKEKIINSIKAE